ncbi:hypothetical protein [Ruegeria halocynthiae]|uniref:hypothetical protein n=1 Tax=Ruegeria halocynthiae TaxID=985054 RepID=UPI000B27839D|nr:hypothetical protein [Ruegeria halocynthiae]
MSFERLTMARTLRNLLLALLNATLILVALCLFLGWKLASTVEGISLALADAVQVAAPLRDDVLGIHEELIALRSDLASIQIGDVIQNTEAAQEVSAALNRLEQLEQNLLGSQIQLAEFTDSPDDLIDQAIQVAADAIADRIIAIRGCVPPG